MGLSLTSAYTVPVRNFEWRLCRWLAHMEKASTAISSKLKVQDRELHETKMSLEMLERESTLLKKKAPLSKLATCK